MAVLAVGLMASGVQAIIWEGENQTIAVELVDPARGQALTQSVTQIQYTLDAGDLPFINGTTVSFTLTNGTFGPGREWDLRLWKIDSLGVHTIEANVFGAPAPGFVQFSVPPGAYSAGDTLYVAYVVEEPDLGAPPAGITFNLDGAVGVTDNFTVRMRSLSPLPLGTTMSTDALYTVIPQFAATQVAPEIRTVDIATGLTEFLSAPVLVDSWPTTRGFFDTTVDNTPPDIPVTDLTGATVTFTLQGPMAAIASLTLRDEADANIGTFTIAGSTATLTISLINALNASYLRVDIDGTTPVAPRQISLTSVMLDQAASPQIRRDRSLLPAAGLAFVWDLNGLIFRVSYMRDMPGTMTSVIRVEGIRGTADLWFVWVTDTNGVEQVFQLPGFVVGAGESRLITARDILDAAAANGFSIDKAGFSATIVFNSPNVGENGFDDWNIWATQQVLGEYRNLPVLIDDARTLLFDSTW